MSATTTTRGTPTPKLEGVHWFVKFDEARGVVQATLLATQVLCFILISITAYLVFQQLRRNRSVFWKASLVGVVLLMPVNLFEIFFTLSQWTHQTLWSFSTINTMVADILVRCGYCLVTLCRFWRLRLIAPVHRSRSMLIFRASSVFVILVTLVSLYSSVSLHIVEFIYKQDGVVNLTTKNATVQYFRDQDRLLQFLTFLLVHVCDLSCDFLFIRAILQSLKRTRQQITLTRTYMVLPYIPPILITILYMTASIIVITKTATTGVLSTFIVFSSIALSRIAPVVETFCFYAFSVHHSRLLLKGMGVTGTTRSGSNPSTSSQGYSRHESSTAPNNRGAYPSSSSGGGAGGSGGLGGISVSTSSKPSMPPPPPVATPAGPYMPSYHGRTAGPTAPPPDVPKQPISPMRRPGTPTSTLPATPRSTSFATSVWGMQAANPTNATATPVVAMAPTAVPGAAPPRSRSGSLSSPISPPSPRTRQGSLASLPMVAGSPQGPSFGLPAHLTGGQYLQQPQSPRGPTSPTTPVSSSQPYWQ
ncbi:hypothetical protein BC828DRAFT_388935 [Blastocladiella britannica]|nr:hypothetical protein BC828DRAFT_388935 [Blastocladiella britannica]